MRKRFYCLTLATILTVLTACGSGSSDSPSTSEPTKAEATTTEAPVAEPTEEATTPTEVVVEEPTPTEKPEDGPNTVDGVDFSIYLKGGGMEAVIERCKCEETRLLFFDHDESGRTAKFEDGGFAALKNGETYHLKYPNHIFIASLYSPKEINVASIEYKGEDINFIDKQAPAYTLQNFLQSNHELCYDGGTMSKEIKIKYEDGTEETFTFTVTDQ